MGYKRNQLNKQRIDALLGTLVAAGYIDAEDRETIMRGHDPDAIEQAAQQAQKHASERSEVRDDGGGQA